MQNKEGSVASVGHLEHYAALIQSIIGEHVAARYANEFRFDVELLLSHQQVSGAFLADDVNVHPEMRWFDELVMLHVVARFAVESKDSAVGAAVQKATGYHLREIQADHATCDPWGLLAFIQYAPPLADQLLHAVRLNYPGQVRGTALLLLQDVLYGLQILMADKHEQ